MSRIAYGFSRVDPIPRADRPPCRPSLAVMVVPVYVDLITLAYLSSRKLWRRIWSKEEDDSDEVRCLQNKKYVVLTFAVFCLRNEHPHS